MVKKGDEQPDTRQLVIIDLIAISEDAKTYEQSETWSPFGKVQFETFVQSMNNHLFDKTKEVKEARKRYSYLTPYYVVEWRRSKIAFFDFSIHGAGKNAKSVQFGISLLESKLLHKCKNGISIECELSDGSLEAHLSCFHYFAPQTKFMAGLLVHPKEENPQDLMAQKWFILKGLSVNNMASYDEELASELLSISLQWTSQKTMDFDDIISRSVEMSLSTYEEGTI